MDKANSTLTHLECSECGKRFDAHRLQTFCPACQAPLVARYDLPKVARQLRPEMVTARPRGLWRWAELLPVQREEHRISLGEGDTPILHLKRLGSLLGLDNLFLKDESLNPTGTFKARGLVMAVARARELKARALVIPTAGNAGGALAAYAARARMEAHVFMPADAPQANQSEVRLYGAELRLVDGLISDAARLAAQEAQRQRWFDVSTFKEPYRLEGKKTMGFEIAEFFDWDVPDVILYPTGGGTGLVGIWKAFEELEALGWIGKRRPRMVSVQAQGCAPIVQAFEAGASEARFWPNASTIASGLRVPFPFAHRLILRVIRQSQGTAIAVNDDEILQAQRELAAQEGVFAAPEGAATLAALRNLLREGWINPSERILLLNPGSGVKYV
ncbi:MAG: threonine synthase [Anaerolineales bacterium]